MRNWFLIVLLAGGCVGPVELDFPGEYEPKVVVYAEFAPDSVWALRLQRSASIDATVDWTRQLISDAIVSVSDNEGFAEDLSYSGEGYYRSVVGSRPLVDREYVLNVTTPSLRPVYAVSVVPTLSVTWNSIEEIRPPDTEADGLYEVQFTLEDGSGPDYYRITVERLALGCRSESGWVTLAEGGATTYSGVEFTSSFPALRPYPSMIADPSEPYFPEEALYGWAWFSDELFEGESLQITLQLDVRHLDGLAPYFSVRVSSLSGEFWRYEVSLSRAYHFDLDFFSDRPVPLYSNVTGGLGIFGGVNRSTWRIDAAGDEWAEADLRVDAPCVADSSG